MSSSPSITEGSDASVYMDRLDEWIQDEGKIVTYKWLSRTLSLSVTSAKQILSSYVEKCKEKTDPDDAAIHVFYTLTGQDKDTSGIMVLLVDEEDREKYESQLQAVYNVAVYSVQKSKPKDTAALYNSDRQCMLDHLSSYSQWNLIKCPNMATRPINNTTPTTTTIEAADHSTSSVCHFASKPTKRKPINKDSVTSFFGKAQKQQTGTSKSSSSNEKENSPIMRKKESITSSVKRSSDTTLQAKPSNGPPPLIKKELVEEEEALLDKEQDNSTSAQAPIESEHIRMVKKEGKIEDSEGPKAKRKPTKKVLDPKPKATQSKRKRKRIQNMSSDESDSEPDQQQKSLPATSITDRTESSSPASSATKKRKRVKKLVTKMFVEEDGSMVTEKHWEEVSTDASDEEKPTLPTPSPMVASSKMAGSSTGKKKKGTQASLMSFFGK
ncbi:PREDICTED: DNA polymerase delta subunit 3-like [Amphimedon queenslandica]|uniref:DNA polymerase delta subunit 3 n=1 Tax=Amphimedon queenslandica TaxID=400682 RepID=A0A1X7VMA2_AMPQE|nr:PREDICTED: DNA polymerase delta subunit 3-like [Amphimedon queenslandica]|eukprot:XP_019863814.1 PREDICTED: DNA polymerase delta subunit 3-like [Amphimedon queenslandica]